MKNLTPYRNAILNRMSPEDLERLGKEMTLIELPTRKRLATANRRIDEIFFIEAGIASTTAAARKDAPLEIGLTGRDGVANLLALMGTDRTGNDTYMQVGGEGFSLETERMYEAMDASPPLVRILMQCAYLFTVQATSTAVANGHATVSERLSRWLLMANDRLDGDEVPLTHEFLSIMLGVRRAGVTVALRGLESVGYVARERGIVRILDRKGLELRANGYYGGAEAEARRLFA